jgi:hypothetical protein
MSVHLSLQRALYHCFGQLLQQTLFANQVFRLLIPRDKLID